MTQEDWRTQLRERGYRLTPQRELILAAVERLGHATPDEVLAAVREQSSAVNVSTVYRTLEVLEPYMRVLPLTVFRNAERRGYAASLEMLVREAVQRSDYPRRDVVITLQADFTDEPGHVATLIKRLESGADIVASNGLPARNAPRLVRWRRPVLNRLVRRLGWPDDVHDPLNGFNAFRVQCLKRAIEERKGTRLLRAEGWAANAQLLHEAAPHARRIDAVELQAHPERLQRASRFLFLPAFNQVLGLRRGRDAEALLAVEALAPASVLVRRSSLEDVFLRLTGRSLID